VEAQEVPVEAVGMVGAFPAKAVALAGKEEAIAAVEVVAPVGRGLEPPSPQCSILNRRPLPASTISKLNASRSENSVIVKKC
jgi:hypothetical protein